MRRYLMVVAVLALIGIAVAGLLTSFHYNAASAGRFCSTSGGCQTVNTSRFAKIGEVPVAVLGLLGYAGVLGLSVGATRILMLRDLAPLGIFGVSLVGVLYSAYLTYLELFVIRAICPWCVASAVIMTLILIASVVEVQRRGRTSGQSATTARTPAASRARRS